MTAAISIDTRFRVTWAFVPTSAVLNVLLLTTIGPVAFRIGVAVMAVLAATCMAVGDVRSAKLRNAWTVPLDTAALLHVLIAITVFPHTSQLISSVLLSVGVNSGMYLAMGLISWVGFGDVKFIVGLTLIAAALIGRAAMLLPLIALLIAAVARAISAHQHHSSSTRPHGPALACAFVLVLAGAWSF